MVIVYVLLALRSLTTKRYLVKKVLGIRVVSRGVEAQLYDL